MDVKNMSNTDKDTKRKHDDPNVYGVIGICGVVSNLIARMLMDHNYNVMDTPPAAVGVPANSI